MTRSKKQPANTRRQPTDNNTSVPQRSSPPVNNLPVSRRNTPTSTLPVSRRSSSITSTPPTSQQNSSVISPPASQQSSSVTSTPLASQRSSSSNNNYNNRITSRSEAIRNLQGRIPGLRLPNEITAEIDNDENNSLVTPVTPTATNRNTPIRYTDPEEGILW